MFETVTEGAKNDGIRGIFYRHFGPIVDAEMAREGVRQVALVLMGVAGFVLVVGCFSIGLFALLSGLILGVPAMVLYYTQSRVVAVILLALFATNAILSFAMFPWIWVLFAVRGTQAAFGYHRLRQTESQVAAGVQSFE